MKILTVKRLESSFTAFRQTLGRFIATYERVIAEFGIGLGGAVLIDAFVIRTVLVPALMHFIGRANWWMPRWLERVLLLPPGSSVPQPAV